MAKKPKLTKEQSEAIEREALRIYGRLNPDQLRVIHTSKQECINQARAKLFPRVKG